MSPRDAQDASWPDDGYDGPMAAQELRHRVVALIRA